MKKLFFLLLMITVLFCPLWAQETEGGGGTQGVILETAMFGNCTDNCTVNPDTVLAFDANLMTNETYSGMFKEETLTDKPCLVSFETNYVYEMIFVTYTDKAFTGGLPLRGA